MNILEIIQVNWNLLDDALKEKGNLDIRVFMNSIYKELSDLTKNCKCMTDIDELMSFEVQIENLIQIKLKNYENYSKKYSEINKIQREIKTSNIKAIISEIFPPLEELYPEKEYPYLKYFAYTKYRTVDDLKKLLDSKEDHPLLFNYLNDSEGVRKLKYLNAFNEFANYMTETYSYKISREEAKKTKLSNEKIPKEIKENFMDAWNHIYEDCKIYKFREITPKKLTENDELINFLIDDNETAYLPAACHNFINWQNDFLKKIIESAKSNDNLNYYIDNMKIEIPLQEATQNQILLIDECFKNSIYDNFDDLIYSFSKRDIFDKEEMINNINYNSYKFEISSLEEELGKLILPEKCMFEGEKNLNFVTFYGEGFRGGKSDTLRKFYSKYPQKDLVDNEKEYIQEQISKISPEKKSKEKFKSLFSSIQLIIFYLANNDFNDEEEIKNIIEKHECLNIDKICKDFFVSNNKFKINQLMNIFFFIEDLFFENLSKSLHKDYKTKIKDENANHQRRR